MTTEKKEFISAPDGLMRAVWKNLPKLELLQRLKNELERLGMTKSPSRTELHERYDNHNMPSPNTYLNLFDCTWAELMTMIGIEYNGIDAIKRGASSKNKGKRHAVKWADMDYDELLDIVLKDMHEKKIKTTIEYSEMRDKSKTPSLPVLSQKLGGWTIVKRAYEDRYGTRIDGQVITTGRKTRSDKGTKRYVEDDSKKWEKLSADEIMELTLSEINLKGFNTKIEYAEGHAKTHAPSLIMIDKKLGGWSEVKKKYKEIYNEEIRL